jgi:hypothetical protein
MDVVSIRRIYSDGNHNAFTDICLFKGDYYVTFRTSSRHIHPDGRALILRGLDGGTRWMAVGTSYSGIDTRDPKFMIRDGELFVYAFSFKRLQDGTRVKASGFSSTRDGNQWTKWKVIEDDWVYWCPKWHEGRAWVIAYREVDGKTMLKTSEDGRSWQDVCLVSEDGVPNETSITFDEAGTMHALIRRGEDANRPFLSQARPPYTRWRHVKLDVSLTGPLLWLIKGEPWICGRWHLASKQVNAAIFKVEGDRAIPQYVLPSGGDCSYAGIVKRPDAENRYLLSYYSTHECLRPWKPEGPMPSDIYLAELELP